MKHGAVSCFIVQPFQFCLYIPRFILQPAASARATSRSSRPRRPRPATSPTTSAARNQHAAIVLHDGRVLLVYVGAPWCEPCQRFHKAAAAGALDARFPRLRLLEFDHDRFVDGLAGGGYTSRYIPLFAVPGPDGRASGRAIEGSIKGEGAVDNIAPRLETLLGGL